VTTCLQLSDINIRANRVDIPLFGRLRLLTIAGLAHLHVRFRFGMVSQRGRGRVTSLCGLLRTKVKPRVLRNACSSDVGKIELVATIEI